MKSRLSLRMVFGAGGFCLGREGSVVRGVGLIGSLGSEWGLVLVVRKDGFSGVWILVFVY